MMQRRFRAVVGALALVLGTMSLTTSPASAAEGLVATSVALSASSDCEGGHLDLGMAVDVATNIETGVATTLTGEIASFSQANDWEGFEGVYDGYGIPFDEGQPDGTLVGSYASVWADELDASSAIEWFVLYRCSETGDNVVMLTCYGDLGTCPQTAQEGEAAAFGATASPTELAAGEVITIEGVGCFYPLAGAVLLRGDAGLGVGDVVEPATDGSFTIELVVPSELSPGALSVQVDCGFEGETVLTETLSAEVVGPVVTVPDTPTTEPAADPPTGAIPVTAAPTYTG